MVETTICPFDHSLRGLIHCSMGEMVFTTIDALMTIYVSLEGPANQISERLSHSQKTIICATCFRFVQHGCEIRASVSAERQETPQSVGDEPLHSQLDFGLSINNRMS